MQPKRLANFYQQEIAETPRISIGSMQGTSGENPKFTPRKSPTGLNDLRSLIDSRKQSQERKNLRKNYEYVNDWNNP
jgi:hypothetical protein